MIYFVRGSRAHFKAHKKLVADSLEIEAFEQYLKQLNGELMRQEAGLTALAAIRFSAPIPSSGGSTTGDGLGVPAKKQGEKAVEADIRAIFRSNENDNYQLYKPVMATSMANFIEWKSQQYTDSTKILYKIWKDSNIDRAYSKVRNLMSRRLAAMELANRKIYINNTASIGSIHEQQRMKYRGRIIRHNGPDREISYSKYIAPESAIKSYIKKRIAKVGWMKAGWAAVINKIGTVNLNGRIVRPAGGKVPKWVSRHGVGGDGRVKHDQHSSDFRERINIMSFWGDADGISMTYGVSRKVIDYRNRMINLSNANQNKVDEAVRLWNAGRIRAANVKKIRSWRHMPF